MTDSPATKPLGRIDVAELVAVVALMAAAFLVPVLRDFVFTTFGVVFAAIVDVAHAVGRAGHDAFVFAVHHLVFGGAA